MSLLGDLWNVVGLDQGKKADAKNRKFQWKMMVQQNQYQKEFAQMGLRWRVADAQAAGLHPLAALGVQGLQGYTPVNLDSSPGATGAAIGRMSHSAAVSRAERTAQAQALLESQSRVRANDAEAAYYSAMAAGANRPGAVDFPEVNANEVLPMPVIPPAAFEDTPTAGGAELVAPKVNMSRPGTTGSIVAGPSSPSLREYTLPGGAKVMLPDATSLGEALEPLSESWALAYAVYRANVRHYGEEWRNRMLNEIPVLKWFAPPTNNTGHKFRRMPKNRSGYVPYEGY